MRTKERKFDVELTELSPKSWKVNVIAKKKTRTIAEITLLDDKHYEVVAVDDRNAPTLTVSSLGKALNSAVMQFNLHLH
ncbi:DUF2969 family protein [Lactobacillus sp. DCY120]|uniref:DUF2969 family protein n=1 Tax=Bombilactobacillus apium TaxID=2675299 RepID=A0A850QY67_9LACO|nr:DUF2969 family protein [Bombilactobacillus apium]NVY95649.1 DUF2969 family protein [Bombilactobacillus apium]